MQSLFMKSANINYNKIASESNNSSPRKFGACVDSEKSHPCILDKNCKAIPFKEYVKHLTDVHHARLCRPLLPVCTEPFRICYKFDGVNLDAKVAIWKYFGQAFLPLVKIVKGGFSFSVIWVGGMNRLDGTFTTKMRISKPGGPKFFSMSQDSLKLKVPVSPLDSGPDGLADASASVVLQKSFLSRFCKKSVEEDNYEMWEWEVAYEVDLSD